MPSPQTLLPPSCVDTRAAPLAPCRPGNLRPRRIILADDHPVVLMGAKIALCSPPDSQSPVGKSAIRVVAEASHAGELIEHLKRTPCDILISDLSMPHGQFPDGLELMSYLKRQFPNVLLIVMTMLCNPSLLKALLHAGVSGLFDKRGPLTELKQAVQTVEKGRRYLSPSFALALEGQTLARATADTAEACLSRRELEVVRLFVQGLSGRQIAAQLNRSEKTISRQKRTAMDKLGLVHGGALVEFARVSGLHG